MRLQALVSAVKTTWCAPRHAISPGFSGHYQDLELSSYKYRMILLTILLSAWSSRGQRFSHNVP